MLAVQIARGHQARRCSPAGLGDSLLGPQAKRALLRRCRVEGAQSGRQQPNQPRRVSLQLSSRRVPARQCRCHQPLGVAVTTDVDDLRDSQAVLACPAHPGRLVGQRLPVRPGLDEQDITAVLLHPPGLRAGDVVPGKRPGPALIPPAQLVGNAHRARMPVGTADRQRGFVIMGTYPADSAGNYP